MPAQEATMSTMASKFSVAFCGVAISVMTYACPLTSGTGKSMLGMASVLSPCAGP